MTKSARSYAFHGLLDSDKPLLQTMVERAARRIEQEWILGEVDVAECVFYRGNAPVNVATAAVLVHFATLADTSAHTLHYPPRVSEVVTLLAAIHPRRSSTTAPATSEAGSWHQLTEQVQRLLAEGGRAALVDASGRGWVLEAADRQYTTAGPSELAPQVLLESTVAPWRLVDAPPANAQPRRPLENLLWFLGIAAGGEGVLATIGIDRPLRMRVWPYLLARAPRKFSEFANQLRHGERSASDLKAAADAPMSEVAAFVNACLLCGFLWPADAPLSPNRRPPVPVAIDAAPPPPVQRFTRFLGAIRHALGMPA